MALLRGTAAAVRISNISTTTDDRRNIAFALQQIALLQQRAFRHATTFQKQTQICSAGAKGDGLTDYI